MEDLKSINGIIKAFFEAFISKDIGTVDVQAVSRLFIPEAIVIKTCGGAPVIYSVDKFIEPRQKILTDGSLTEFREAEEMVKTEIFGDIAQSFVRYRKTGVHNGTSFNVQGMKTIQFVRTTDGWKMSSVAWDDERDGVKIQSND
jgi:hypothetical protein